MTMLEIYCMSLYNSTYEVIKNLGYIPVGLKNKDFSKEWLRDNTLKNISDMRLCCVCCAVTEARSCLSNDRLPSEIEELHPP